MHVTARIEGKIVFIYSTQDDVAFDLEHMLASISSIVVSETIFVFVDRPNHAFHITVLAEPDDPDGQPANQPTAEAVDCEQPTSNINTTTRDDLEPTNKLNIAYSRGGKRMLGMFLKGSAIQ